MPKFDEYELKRPSGDEEPRMLNTQAQPERAASLGRLHLSNPERFET